MASPASGQAFHSLSPQRVTFTGSSIYSLADHFSRAEFLQDYHYTKQQDLPLDNGAGRIHSLFSGRLQVSLCQCPVQVYVAAVYVDQLPGGMAGFFRQ